MLGDMDEKHSNEKNNQVPILEPDEILLTRMKTLATHFTSKYKCEPSFFVKIPGRVNLIGEHIDYCGYAVCPMAIEQNIMVAVAISQDSKIHLSNVNPRYEDFQCDLKNAGVYIDQPRLSPGPAWYKYFLCGVKGALETIPEDSVPKGIFATVLGNIPPNAGLSSSSALVSAALLSVVHASQWQLSKQDLATISAIAERHIGTQGGGMDQAIAFLAKPYTAKLIEFNPLRATDVTLPENAVFVIAHSQAVHNKASTTDYNLRVAECRFAAQIIAKKRNKNWEEIQKLIDVQRCLDVDLDEIVSIVTTELHEEPYNFNEICENLGTTCDQLKRTSLVGAFSASQTFKLRQRALHVFQEANRVELFRRISEEDTIMEDEKLRHLGNLMLKSHTSLRELYECSHPRVDDLVSKAMSFGAFGARITGAGWGGCIVAITSKDKVAQFVNDLRQDLSRYRTEDGPVNLDDLAFPTKPHQGAAIYKL